MKFFGLKTCDTCRKARKELTAAQIAFTYIDVRADGVKAADLDAILGEFGEAAINRSSTTWRALDDAEKLRDPAMLLAEHPTLLKRPVIIDGDKMTLGWKPEARAQWISAG